MKIDFKWNKALSQVSRNVIGGDATQLFLANEAKRLMEPYVPALNLVLTRNVRTYVEGGRGIVHYLSPYARYQYEGKVMVSKRPRVKGSAKAVRQPEKALNYTKLRHPLATSHWDQAMMVARGDDLVQSMQNFIRSRK